MTHHLRLGFCMFIGLALATTAPVASHENVSNKLALIQAHRHEDAALSQLLPIVRCSFQTSTCEELLMTKLRDVKTDIQEFRRVTDIIGGLLATKVMNILPTCPIDIRSPLMTAQGIDLAKEVHLVSIMRSGDALLNQFTNHFPRAPINKILIQRDEETALPNFKYIKVAPSLGSDSIVIITEPMLATGGTLHMVIDLLKEKGVKEEHIIIACICTAPEGLLKLSTLFPKVGVVMILMDEGLNERKYIIPGIGDFGDRYFGTAD